MEDTFVHIWKLLVSHGVVPSDDTPKGKRTPEQQALYQRTTVAFYDIDKKAWRSMRVDTIWSYKRALKLS